MINLLPDQQREDPISRQESFTGLKVDYVKQLRISFGDYAECKNPNRKPFNGPKPRSDPCIALIPARLIPILRPRNEAHSDPEQVGRTPNSGRHPSPV